MTEKACPAVGLIDELKLVCCVVLIWAALPFVLSLFGCEGVCAAAGEKPVVVGDHFTITQKDLGAYREYLEKKHAQMPPDELLRMVIQTQLLSRAYDEENDHAGRVNAKDGKAETVAEKLLHAREYQQKLLGDYRIPDDVVESYYRSHPQKYQNGIAGGMIETKPLDGELAREIRFEMVEAKRQQIIEDFVNGQIAKYHIKKISE